MPVDGGYFLASLIIYLVLFFFAIYGIVKFIFDVQNFLKKRKSPKN